MQESFKIPSATFPTLTGSIVTFNSQYAGLPLKSHKIALTATQSGSGTPSPDNVRTINGYSAINIGNSIAYDTNIEQGTLDDSGLNANATNRIRTADYIPIVSGHTYKITLKGSGAYYLGVSGYTANDYTTPRTQSTAWLSNNTDLLIDAGVKYIRINVRFMTNTGITPADLTGIFITDITNYFTIQIGSTVYGGEYDARSGVLACTWKGIKISDLSWTQVTTAETPYFRSSLTDYKYISSNNNIFSEIYTPASIGATGSNEGFLVISGGQFRIRDTRYNDATAFVQGVGNIIFMYELATPTTIQLPPCPIDTLEVNNIWADTGDTTLQYPKFG